MKKLLFFNVLFLIAYFFGDNIINFIGKINNITTISCANKSVLNTLNNLLEKSEIKFIKVTNISTLEDKPNRKSCTALLNGMTEDEFGREEQIKNRFLNYEVRINDDKKGYVVHLKGW